MRWKSLVARGLLLAMVAAAEPLDRIAVSVGNQVVTESALMIDLRVTAFMNQGPVDLSPAARRAEAERLVDQLLILKEASDSHLVLPEGEPLAALAMLKARYRSDQEYQLDLMRYGIHESDLIQHLKAGARSMAFTDLRFRPGTRIDEDELLSYYNGLVGAQASAGGPTFEDSRAEIEDLLRGQRALESLDEWLKTARKAVRIEYREKVFK